YHALVSVDEVGPGDLRRLDRQLRVDDAAVIGDGERGLVASVTAGRGHPILADPGAAALTFGRELRISSRVLPGLLRLLPEDGVGIIARAHAEGHIGVDVAVDHRQAHSPVEEFAEALRLR